LGKACTGTPPWKFSLDGGNYLLQVAEKTRAGSVTELGELQVVPGVIWAGIKLTAPTGSLKLDGIPNAQARELLTHLRHALDVEAKARSDLAADKLLAAIAIPLKEWASAHEQAQERERKSRGWLSKEFIESQIVGRPEEIGQALAVLTLRQRVPHADSGLQDAVKLWDRDFRRFAEAANVQHLESERRECADFLRRVEKSPLSQEQINAVVCFDSRVLLVASAGSGKTSTMVAKAGYALHRGYFAPESILLLAFNNAAAAELRERITARLGPLGLPSTSITAKTFHSFGLDVIGEATGKRPSIAPWLESGGEMDALMRMVDNLKDTDLSFRSRWDMFRIVFGQDLPSFGKEEEGKDSWDRETRKEGFWTLNGETVKSRGELLIANWLFYNGVEYEYERPYEHSTADASHRQYNPDFYFPSVGAYLEHWALDENGRAPAAFHGYLEGMQWKRALHKEHGTKLIETTMAQLWNGQAFKHLEQELAVLGVKLDPNPDRPAAGRKAIESPRLARTFRTFMVHAKSNRLSMDELRNRLSRPAPGPFIFRHRMFLELYERIASAWQAELGKGSHIDFEDMLVAAGDLIEQGRWRSKFELVMVDEFQDASQARARILIGLTQRPRTCLFGVGDDWQSINRYAGADLSVMTDFEGVFGRAVALKLEQTFRCPPSLCALTSAFVQKNPGQIRKNVRSVQPDIQDSVSVIQLTDLRTQSRLAVERQIRTLQEQDPTSRPSVLVLGRYRHDKDHFPSGFDPERVRFLTVHTSKGLEADHVIVLGVTSETLGFPSRVEDDPVLQLALPAPEPFDFAEERRLFYVALTRARKTVTLITQLGRESTFVLEVLRDHKIPTRNHHGETAAVAICPTCGKGTLVSRKGRYGHFFGCSTFPSCNFTKNAEAPEGATTNTRRPYRRR
jgi:DNA helicase-4